MKGEYDLAIKDFNKALRYNFADELVALEIVESLSVEGVRKILKKTPYVRIGPMKMRSSLRRWSGS